MEPPAKDLILHGVVRAGTDRLAVCLPGIAAMSAIAFESWLLFGASLSGYLGLVVGRLARRRFWRETAEELRRAPPPLPDRSGFAVVAARQFVDRMEVARAERERAMELVSPSFPPSFAERLGAVVELERQALALVRRLDDLGAYLATKSLPILRADRVRLAHAAEKAPTARVRREYQRALAVLQTEIDALDQIALRRDLLTARLERLVGALELLPPALMQLEFAEDDRAVASELDADVLLAMIETLEREEPNGLEGSGHGAAAGRAYARPAEPRSLESLRT